MDRSDYNIYRDDYLAACQKGDYFTFKQISDKYKGIVNFRCPITHENGLHKCARNSEGTSSRIAKHILAQVSGSTLNECKSKGNYTPLILATHLQNEDMVLTLIKNIETKLINWTNDKEIVISDTERYIPHSTALHVAILSENINIINILLSAGALFWIADQNGDSALELVQKARNVSDIMYIFCNPLRSYAHYLICHGNRDSKTIELLRIFFENGLDVNSKDLTSVPLLYKATEIGDIATMRFLISRGAHMNVLVSHTNYTRRYDNSTSALHIATKTMNTETMNCLLKAGADVNLRDMNGQMALHILCATRSGTVKKAFDCCKLLIQHGARVKMASSPGLTPFENVLNNGTKMSLAIYIISAGGDSSNIRNPTRSPVQLVNSLRYIPKQLQKLFLEFRFESGFPIKAVIPILQNRSSELATYLELKQQTPRTLRRLTANVIRKAMVPNAWVGLKELPLPPGFDQQYILLDPNHVVSILRKEGCTEKSGMWSR